MPARPKLADPGQLIRSAKRRTDTYRLCTDPDLVAEYEQLLEQIAAEQEAVKERDSLDAAADVAALREQLAAVMERVDAATVVLTFQSIGRPKYRALKDEHPVRKNEAGEIVDRRSVRVGVDYDPFFAALLPLSLVSPVLDEETLTHLVDEVLSNAQWTELTTVMWNLNEGTVDVPFSPAVSPKTKGSSPR
jgi:hypothetical protein